MKKSPIVLSIFMLLFVGGAAALLACLPLLSPSFATLYATPADLFTKITTGFLASFIAMFMLVGGYKITGLETISLVWSCVLYLVLALLVIFWICHFIILIAKKRGSALWVNLFWLIFGALTYAIVLCSLGFSSDTQGYIFEGSINVSGTPTAFHDVFGFSGVLIAKGSFVESILALAPLVAAGIGFILGFIGVCISIHDCFNHSKGELAEEDKSEPQVESVEEKSDCKDGTLLRAQNQHLLAVREDDGSDLVRSKYQKTPLIVQNISYTPGVFPSQPSMVDVTPNNKALTAEDVRSIIAEELSKDKAGEKEEEKQDEATPEVNVEERPLTAKELRLIIKNELQDHDHPEELLPLTDEQCRNLIREELDDYYAGTKTEETPETSETPSEENEEFMTAEDLGNIIKEEVLKVLNEEKSKEPLPASLKTEDVRLIVKEELTASHEEDDETKKALEEVRQRADDAKYSLQAADNKNAKAIEEVKNAQLNAEQIRTIVAAEIDKRLSLLLKEQEQKPVNEVKEEPVVVVKEEPKPAPVEEPIVVPTPAPVEDEKPDISVKVKTIRVPFATRVLASDKELQQNYNELKEEALSYGLKSRLSVAGDTFRLHTKTYLRIAVAGKGLKLYLALDPHEYKDSTIPVKDVGAKNIYKDIPLVFKVKSPLSVKRAKQLIADACAKDSLVKQTIMPLNYVAQLESYKVSGGDEEEMEDEEEE